MSIRRLRKMITPDALARALNKTPSVPKGETLKRQKPPREGATYRGARRNATLRGETKSVWKGAASKRGHYVSRAHNGTFDSSNPIHVNRRRPDWAAPNGKRQRERLARQHAKQQAKVA